MPYPIENAIRKIQETKLALGMNDALQIMAYADDVNLIGGDVKLTKRNANIL